MGHNSLQPRTVIAGVDADLGMHDGVVVVLPDVVVNEDVLDVKVKGVDPQGLPAADGEGVRGPPGWDTQGEELK